MKKQTFADRLSGYFLAVGYKEIPSKNNYRMFELQIVVEDTVHVRYVFIGANGAVRVNTDSKSAAGSFSKTDEYKDILARWEASKAQQHVRGQDRRQGDRRMTKSKEPNSNGNGNGPNNFKRNVG